MRIIDADRLRNKVIEWMPPDPCGIEERSFPYETDVAVSLIMEIDEAPTIDIVLCKDCKYEDNCEQMVLLSSMYGEVEDTRAIDFCSYGERSE